MKQFLLIIHSIILSSQLRANLMERFVFQVIEPLISQQLDEARHKQRSNKILEELRLYCKGELVPINKELAKKTRELFVASSDLESFKEKFGAMERQMIKVRGELAVKENELVKQRLIHERDSKEIKEQVQTLKKEIKKIMRKGEQDLQRANDENKEKMSDYKRQQKKEMQSRLQQEKDHWEEIVNANKEAAAQEKNHLMQETSKEKSRIIKKYQEKIYQIKSQSDDAMEKTVNQYNAKIVDLKKAKTDLLNKLTVEEATTRRLTLQLDKQSGQHGQFRHQFESTFKELQNTRKRSEEQRQRLIGECQSLRTKMKDTQRELSQQIKELKCVLAQTIAQKDKKFIDTVQLMTTEHRIQMDSLQNELIEDKEATITNMEIKAYEQMFQQIKKYQKLEDQFKDLSNKYNEVKSSVEAKVRELREEQEMELANLHERKAYEFELEGQNSKRQYSNLLNKFNLQIRSMRSQHSLDMQSAQKKAQEDKVAAANKLISQYENMLNDQRNNTEVQIRQKMMEFERKARAYEKRIVQAEKRKSELKVVIERMKMQSQMKIQSMMEVNEKQQGEIEELHERILELQKTKASNINDYEFKLLLLRNQVQKTKEEYRERQDELRANLNEKIIVKNKETAKFAELIKQETQQLIRKNKQKTTALEKQYEQLKRVINQKTSLPEDIDALKIFHAAYLEKENELISERRRRQELQRQLHSKDAIEKVFTSKEAFKRFTVIDKISQTPHTSQGTRLLAANRLANTPHI